jgi:hypothetical protein
MITASRLRRRWPGLHLRSRRTFANDGRSYLLELALLLILTLRGLLILFPWSRLILPLRSLLVLSSRGLLILPLRGWLILARFVLTLRCPLVLLRSLLISPWSLLEPL